MTRDVSSRRAADAERTATIRATYEEFPVGDTMIAMIADPQNAHAWIQSDVTAAIEP